MNIRSLSLSLVLLSSIVSAEETHTVFKVSPLAVRTEGACGVELFFCNGEFGVLKDGVMHPINKEDIDADIRNMSDSDFQKYTGMGKFKVVQFDNGEFAVRTAGGLNGGGPVTAVVFYGLTKCLCWLGVGTGTALVGAGIAAGTVATGGVAGAITGTLSGGAVVASGLGVPAAAAVAGGALVGGVSAVAPAAVTSVAITAAQTAAVAGALAPVATVGIIAGTAAAIEGVSVGAFACGMALPLP